VWSTRCDLSDPDGGRDRLISEVAERLGPVDILVNNAASNGYRPFTDWTPRRLEIAQQVNVWAPWRLMADVVGTMRARRAGWIVNITSAAAELPVGPPFPPNQVAMLGSGYGSTKAALDRLTVAVAAETHGEGIRVNAIAPQAAIATPHLVAAGGIPDDLFEPMETMAEAVLALATADEDTTGRIWRSLDLLVELGRPVRTLDGRELADGWQPADLPARIARQRQVRSVRDS
jgi:NAD(P)-dependent dehydrogenase (short-subunit alcohol dehydrogenase family)